METGSEREFRGAATKDGLFLWADLPNKYMSHMHNDKCPRFTGIASEINILNYKCPSITGIASEINIKRNR